MILRTLHIALTTAAIAAAQDTTPLAEQPTPFSVWLDIPALTRPHPERPALPIWFESFQSEHRPPTATEPPKTIYRLRIRRLPTLQRELLIRIYFDDLPGMLPTLTAWSETGRETYRSTDIGLGLSIPTSHTAIIPLHSTDYLEIETPGDGTTLRGAIVSSLKNTTTLQTIDFHPTPHLIDPFGNHPAPPPTDIDTKLFGRVRATLDTNIIRLHPAHTPSYAWDFELAAQPLIAAITFDILNADITAPPVLVANDSTSSYVNIQWPDLADPAYRGESRGGESSMRFQYTGWLRAHCTIRSTDLRSGLNKIIIGLSEGSGRVAIRNIELQLKQNWKHLDYTLTPANR